MQSLRPTKIKFRKSTKPRPNEALRLQLAAAAIIESGIIAMVSCTECVKHNNVCYYDREQSVKCAECLRKQRSCDGTFALEEFRKVGEQKKLLQARAAEKRRVNMRHRKALMDARQAAIVAQASLVAAEKQAMEAEVEEADLSAEIAYLDDQSSRMLRRELQALGVMSSVEESQEVVLADPDFVWEAMPVSAQIDWELMMHEVPADGVLPSSS